MADRITRFGVSIPARELKRFDETIDDLGYENRSKAILDAINEFNTQKNITGKGSMTSTISYIYDHHVSDVNKKLVELQHGFEENIKSTMHSHITHDLCVEVLIVHGTTSKIQKLYGGLSAIKGVKNCKIAVLESG